VVETVTNSFRKCGIWPLNPNAFSDADYAPSQTTDRPLDHTYASDPVSGEAGGSSSVQMSTIPASAASCEAGVQSAAELPSIPVATSGAAFDPVSDEAGGSSDPVSSEAGGSSSMQVSNIPASPASGEAVVQSAAELPSISVATSGAASDPVSDEAGGSSDPVSSEAGGALSVQVSTIHSTQSHSQPMRVSPFDIAAPPSVEGQVAKRRRRATTSTVLTWSPYMNEVKLRDEKKRKVSSVSKALFKEMEKCGDNHKRKQCKVRSRQKQQNKQQKKGKSEPKKTADEQETCTLCGFVFGDSSDPKLSEDWAVCVVCQKWFHDTCAQADGILDDDDLFTCGKCFG